MHPAASSLQPPGSLAVYAHVPFCRHACPYCDFYKLELRDRPARQRLEFPGLLAREFALLCDAMPELEARPLASIYFGGGTPSTLSPKGVGELVRELTKGTRGTEETDGGGRAIRTTADGLQPETTLEANPENLTPARCEAWRGAEITRLSIGAQSFHPRDLGRLERLHGPETIVRAVRNAREAGFANLSLDLMFALPGQTPDEWMDNVGRALELGPEHISFYGLTLHEGTPFHGEFRRGKLVAASEDLYAEMYEAGAEAIERAGFEHYEISNFARPGFRSRHNQRYWTREDVLGLGPGAHSNVGERRWANPDDIDAWRETILAGETYHENSASLTEISWREEAVFCGLRRVEGLPLGEESVRRWLAGPRGMAARDAGFLRDVPGRMALTRRGWLVSDAIIREILE